MSDIDRRAKDLCELPYTHLLQPIIMDILQEQADRPAANDVYQRLEAMRSRPEVVDSLSSDLRSAQGELASQKTAIGEMVSETFSLFAYTVRDGTLQPGPQLLSSSVHRGNILCSESVHRGYIICSENTNTICILNTELLREYSLTPAPTNFRYTSQSLVVQYMAGCN